MNSKNLIVDAIIGKVTIYDTKKYQTKKELIIDKKLHFANDDYFSNKTFGFMLKNAKEFKIPIPAKGKLGLFEMDITNTKTKDQDITSEIFDEEYRTRWINHH